MMEVPLHKLLSRKIMNNIYTYFFIIFSTSSLMAQDIFGPQQVLINDLLSVQNVAAGDVTGNGYQDLLATGFFGTRIMLFENSENGFENATVLVEGDVPRAIVAIDIENDGDMDVAYSINNTRDLQYIINNGDGTFANPVTIGMNILNIFDLKSVDIDGDSDMDILLASAGVLPRWYENENGAFTEHIISGTTGRSLELGDIDQDGDIDIVSSAAGSITCVWYENNGTGSFSAPQTIRGAGLASSSVFVSDLNGDSLLDVMITVPGDESVAWFENLGGGSFGPEQNITTTLDFATRVIAADLDNDSDIDVIAAGADELVWYENMDGEGTFGDKVIISEEVEVCFSIVAVDLDNDGDLDVANTSRNNHTVAWYENTTILGINGPKAIAFKIYPNPSSEYFIIQATQAGVAGYTLYDLQGKVLQQYPANTHTIDARSLASGMYILGLNTVAGDRLFQKLVRK